MTGHLAALRHNADPFVSLSNSFHAPMHVMYKYTSIFAWRAALRVETEVAQVVRCSILIPPSGSREGSRLAACTCEHVRQETGCWLDRHGREPGYSISGIGV